MHSTPSERKVTQLVSVKWNRFRIMTLVAGGVMLVTFLGAYALACAYVYLAPTLPSADAMRNAELQVPLRVYTRSGALIAQIGEQRRIPVTYEQIPDLVRHAFLAAEDDRFFEHHGIDYFGVLRAAVVDVISGRHDPGRQHHHHAGGAQHVPDARQDRRAASSRRSSSPIAWSTSSPSRRSSGCT